MTKLVIIDEDDFSRAQLESALQSFAQKDWDISLQKKAKEEQAARYFFVGDMDDKPLFVKENNCFPRPLRMGVLLDRAVRLFTEERVGALVIGSFALDRVSGILTNQASGAQIRLTDKEKQILEYLYEADGEIIARQVLLDKVWDYAQGVETHTLETHIYRLRQKIEKDPSAPKILVTEDTGYRLIVA